MEKFDFVELTKDNEELKQKNILRGCCGTIIEFNDKVSKVIFFNNNNWGEYAIADVENLYLKKIGQYPSCDNELLLKFVDKLDCSKHQNFKPTKIKEYDKVELIVENEKYTKHNIHKGDVGCVISQYAIKNQVEVDFSRLDKNNKLCGSCLIVNIDDLKILNS